MLIFFFSSEHRSVIRKLVPDLPFFFSYYIYLVKWNESHSAMSTSLQPHGLYSPWNSTGQKIGVRSRSFLQGTLPTQGSNPGRPHCRWTPYQLSHYGSPRILEGLAYPFSSGSSWPRNETGVFCISGGFFTNLALREALHIHRLQTKHNFLFIYLK